MRIQLLSLLLLTCLACGPNRPDAGDAGSSADAGPADAGGPCSIAFVQPAITPSTDPPVAEVQGSGTVEIQFSCLSPVTSVVLEKSDLVLAQWISPIGTDVQRAINWTAEGSGTLTATVTSTDGSTASTSLTVEVH